MNRKGIRKRSCVFAEPRLCGPEREVFLFGYWNPGIRALGVFETGRPGLDWVHFNAKRFLTR